MRDLIILLIGNLGGFYLGWRSREDFQRKKDKCRIDLEVMHGSGHGIFGPTADQ
jgi:hypothetical protein